MSSNGGTGDGINVDIPQVSVDSLPDNVRDSYEAYEKHGWKGSRPGQTKGTSAGGDYSNDGRGGGQILPTETADGEAIIYREFDDNNKVGIHRDAQRFVVGSDGKVYFSNDHYLTLVEIVE